MSETGPKILLPAKFQEDPHNPEAVCIRFSDGSRSASIMTPEEAEKEIELNLQTGRLTSIEASDLRKRNREAQEANTISIVLIEPVLESPSDEMPDQDNDH